MSLSEVVKDGSFFFILDTGFECNLQLKMFVISVVSRSLSKDCKVLTGIVLSRSRRRYRSTHLGISAFSSLIYLGVLSICVPGR